MAVFSFAEIRVNAKLNSKITENKYTCMLHKFTKNTFFTCFLFEECYNVKSDKDWRNWSRVKLLKMYYNETDYAILELEDSRTLQCFDVGLLGYNDKDAANWTLKFEILDVYPGEKYEDTVISELYFDGVDVH